MSDDGRAMVGGLIGVGIVAVALLVLGASLLAMLPLAVSAVFLGALLVRDLRS